MRTAWPILVLCLLIVFLPFFGLAELPPAIFSFAFAFTCFGLAVTTTGAGARLACSPLPRLRGPPQPFL